MLRRHLLLVALALPLLGTGVARAATEAPFSQDAFAAAQKAGRPILIDITATWCPTCAAQKPILDKLATDPAFKDLTIFKVDFDAQKDVVRTMGAQMQSTLIAFHGSAEKARSTGDTSPSSIRSLLAKTGT
jgi:thioredoxin 1